MAAIQRQRFDDGTLAGKPGLPDQRVIRAVRPLSEALKRHWDAARNGQIRTVHDLYMHVRLG